MNIFITGGSQGIGLAIAESCAQAGHSLFLVAQQQPALYAAIDRLAARTHGVHGIAVDLTEKTVIQRVTDATQSHDWVPDVLVLNAGIWVAGGVGDLQEEDFDRVMHLHVSANLALVNAFLPSLRKSAYPRIILIGSTAGLEPHHRVDGTLYSVSKWATHGLAVNLRQDLMTDGIGVTHIAPGSTATGLWDPSEIKNATMLEPADIGKVVVSLLTLSPQAVVEEVVVRPLHGNIR